MWGYPRIVFKSARIILILALSGCIFPPSGSGHQGLNPPGPIVAKESATPMGSQEPMTPTWTVASPPGVTRSPTITPAPPPAPFAKTGIVFLIDVSDSMNGEQRSPTEEPSPKDDKPYVPSKSTGGSETICTKDSKQQNLRYQVPEYITTLLAALYADAVSLTVLDFTSHSRTYTYQ